MSNNKEYGSAYTILAQIRNNKDACCFDPPYPPKPKIQDQPVAEKSPEVSNSQVETASSDHMSSMIYACLLGKRIKQRDLVPARDFQSA